MTTTTYASAYSTFSPAGLTYHSATDTVYRVAGESTVLGTVPVALVGTPWDITAEEWAEIGVLDFAR